MPVIRPEPTGRVEILDLTAVAYCCNVSPFTPQQWRQRNVLPPVDYPEVSTPLWKVATIREWARRTNRSFREPVPQVPHEQDAVDRAALVFSVPG